jgi:DNA-binding beta-propeller fold protein YncE
MRSLASRVRIALSTAALLLAGCAQVGTVRGTLHYGLDDAPEGRRLTWPQGAEVPRYLYAGTLTGEPNFRRENEGGGLRAFGRWLVGLDGQPAAPVVLQRPAAVVGDDAGRLFVSDTSRQAVFVFDEAQGELNVWERATATLNFVAPVGLAPAPQRGLYVADAELGIVVRLDATGQPLAVLGRGMLKRPTGLAIDAGRGRLYVADTAAHDVKVFDDAGTLVATIGRRGEAPGEFNFPTHLAFANGELVVADTLNSRVQILDPDGVRAPRTFGTRGLYVGNLVRPKGVSVDGEGHVYVIESYHDSLLVFTPQGDLLLPIGGTGTATGRFYLPSGVWVDAKQRVHIADMFNGRVVVFQFLGG